MVRAWAGTLFVALLIGPVAAAHQTKDQQKCTNALNKGLAKVASAAAKDAVACLKNAAKGKTADLGPDQTAQSCLSADVKGKVSKAQGKLAQDASRFCVGDDKNGVPRFPSFGATDPSNVSGAAREKELDLVADLFGSDLDAALIPDSTDKAAAKCQLALLKAATKCESARLKEFNKCKKAGLEDELIEDAVGLEACIGVDPKGKIAKACDDSAGPDKIRKDIAKKCAGKGVGLATAFPGCASANDAELHACVATAAECRACRAIETADNLVGGCSACIPRTPIGGHLGTIDDRAFCVGGSREGLPCESILTHVDCPPGPPTARCMSVSFASINTRGVQPLLSIGWVGNFEILCDPNEPPDPQTGKVACACNLRDLEPLSIPIIGHICFPSFDGCGPGEIDCDGGEPMDLDLVSDHDVGQCGTNDDPNDLGTQPGLGNAECETLCEGYCQGLPGAHSRFASACEGYCQAGPREAMSCSFDVDCPDGSCAGGDPVAHRNVCNCHCLEIGGDPGRPGAFRCEAGAKIEVESAAPCMSLDQIDDRILSLPGTCVPLTSERSNGRLLDADKQGVAVVGAELVGIPNDCLDLATSITAGATQVGHSVSFDSALGDLEIMIGVLGK